jgi:hypothetical protein
MEAIITQNNQKRRCKIELGQKVKHPEGFWGRIIMFGEDENQKPRLLMSNDNFTFSKKRGVYPNEINLLIKDFEKGELINI